MTKPSAANNEIQPQKVLAPSNKDDSDSAIFNTRSRKKATEQA